MQFLGTPLFNANTFDAMLPELGWLQQDLAVLSKFFPTGIGEQEISVRQKNLVTSALW